MRVCRVSMQVRGLSSVARPPVLFPKPFDHQMGRVAMKHGAVLDVLRKQSNSDPSSCPLLTHPRTEVMKSMLDRLHGTPEGGFVKSSNVLVGSRGVGKSTVLCQIQSVASNLDEKLRVVYVDLSRIKDFSVVSPSSVLQEIVGKEGLQAMQSKYNSVDPHLEALSRARIRAALLYDESESLYVYDSEAGREFLRELHALANTSFTNCFTLLCGSSAALPALVAANAQHDPTLSKEYNLKPINLNGSKFTTIRIPAQPSVQDFENAIDAYLPDVGDEPRKGLARLLLFWTGVSLRHACETLQTLRSQPESVSDVLKERLLRSGPMLTWDSRGDHTYLAHKEVINALMDKLVDANKDILDRLPHPSDASALLRAVVNSDLCVNSVAPRRSLRVLDRDSPTGVITTLVDKGWFLQSPSQDEVYPITLAQLYYTKHFLKEGQGERIRRKMGEMFDHVPGWIKEAVRTAILGR